MAPGKTLDIVLHCFETQAANALNEVNFRISETNDLTELSELRFELNPSEQDFSLKCRLRFGTMQYEHSGREYEIGVTRAFLRLNLEGCETTLSDVFGESELAAVDEIECAEDGSELGGSMAGKISSDGRPGGSLAVHGGKTKSSSRLRQSTKTHLPVVARPNDCWEVFPEEVSGRVASAVKGTAVPNVELCKLRRKAGGNRISVIGEVHVSRSGLRVSASRGNKMGKTLSEWQNKDAIVSLILKKAVHREASAARPGAGNAVVAISSCEISEE